MTREVEFIARFPKMKQVELSEDELSERDLQRLVNGDAPDTGTEYEIEFEYLPVVLNMDDVKLYFKYDRTHTTIKLFDGDAFVIKYKYNHFKLLREQLSGSFILKADELKFEEKLAAKAVEVQAILNSLPAVVATPNTGTRPASDGFMTSCSDDKC